MTNQKSFVHLTANYPEKNSIMASEPSQTSGHKTRNALNPPADCSLCPRLVAYRAENRAGFPEKYNGAVPAFGNTDTEFLVVGLAPGLKGANFTGRPFTGDWAGDLLYQTLLKFDFAEGDYKAHADDGLTLKNCRITNAVRCVPPQNKPTGDEIKTCRDFLTAEISALSNLKVILALGQISHNAVVKTLGGRQSAFKFGHGIRHELPHPANRGQNLALIDSYHCSRYNTNTGRLTTEMFEAVFKKISKQLDS